MATKRASLQARIDRILKRFNDPTEPQLMDFVSGVSDSSATAAIDDGARYQHDADDTPDFVKKVRDAWPQ